MLVRSALGEDDNDVAYAWTRIGWNQYHLEAFEEAESSFERAITLRETAGAEPENLAGCVQELGEYYAWRRSEERRGGKECRSRWPPHH